MVLTAALLLLLLLSCIVHVCDAGGHNFEQRWMSTLNGDLEYQAAPNLSPLAELHWRRLTNSATISASDYFNHNFNQYLTMYADGSETYYDEYAQAWRFLGFYIDCDDDVQFEDLQQRNNQDQQDRNDNVQATSYSICRRYLLWAAYVDEHYSGHGRGEYMYYDRRNNVWDNSACTNAGNKERCVKMDCHLPQSSHYTLLGYFKESSYDNWIDTLTRYQGDCIWTDNEYTTMTQLSRTAWPQKCTASIYTTKNDEVVYYDMRPMEYGNMVVGLYTDDMCTREYIGPLTAQEVLKGMVCGGYVDGGDDHDWDCGGSSSDTKTSSSSSSPGSSSYSLQDHLQLFNSALDALKQCQPCKAYDLTSMVAGRKYRPNIETRHPERQNYDSDQSYPTFMCNVDYRSYYNMADDAIQNNNQATFHPDYSTLNQCMLFRTQTSMIPATWTDVELAGVQGTITSVQLNNNAAGSRSQGSVSHSRTFHSYGKGLEERSRDSAYWIVALMCLATSTVAFCFTLYNYCVTIEEYGADAMNDGLMVVRQPTGMSA